MVYISSERDSQGETPALYHVDATYPVESRCSASGQEGIWKGPRDPMEIAVSSLLGNVSKFP